MNLELVKLSEEYKSRFFEMMDEWMSFEDYNRSPSVIRRYDYHDFDSYINLIDRKEEVDGYPTNDVYFCLDKDRDIFVGAVDIRLYITAKNGHSGGHVGDGIRPSERGKGYGTQMIALALKRCEELGMNKVLFTCDKSNIASRKSIINNGGVYEYDVADDDGSVEERYWITLHEETIETDRMILRRELPGDFKEAIKFLGDERVCEYLTIYPKNDDEKMKSFLESNDPNSMTRFIMLAIDKIDGHTIGSICIRKYETTDIWRLSYSLCYDEWGKGYTTEGSKALMDYVSNKYGASKFEIEACVDNVASVRIAEKLGYHFDHYSEYSKCDNSKTYKSAIFLK